MKTWLIPGAEILTDEGTAVLLARRAMAELRRRTVGRFPARRSCRAGLSVGGLCLSGDFAEDFVIAGRRQTLYVEIVCDGGKHYRSQDFSTSARLDAPPIDLGRITPVERPGP